MFKKTKSCFSFVLITIFLNSTLFCNSYLVYANNNINLNVCADGAILMDAKSGEILYEKNMNNPYPPASTTKIMTALLTLENCPNLDEMVTISKTCEDIDGSKIYVFQDEKISVRELLYALILASANDCAYALAEHIGGTYDNFVNMMNNRAKELGCSNTTFANPHGLYDKNHRTSAHDLAYIMKELIKHEEYIKISSTKSYKMTPTNKCTESRPLWNGNKAIHEPEPSYYTYCKAAKTGYTTESLHSYVTYSKKGDQELIIALIHDKDKKFYTDSKSLFEYGFNNFETKKVLYKNEKVASYALDKNNSLELITDKDIYVTYNKKLSQKNTLKIPNIDLNNLNLCEKSIRKGDFIKEISITYGDKSYPIKLLSNSDYTPTTILSHNNKPNINFTYTLLKYLLIFILILLILLTSLRWFKIRKIHKKYAKYRRRKVKK